MEPHALKFLQTLMTTPSPSGYEEKARVIWRNFIKNFSDTVSGDFHGNSISSINPKKSPKIMLAGHIDEIAFQVKYVHKSGYIYFNPLGGFDVGIIPGRKVRIHSRKQDVLGVIGRKAIHLIDTKDRGKPSEMYELFIDIGIKDKKDVEKLIEIGDPITYDNNFEALNEDVLVSRAFDDKIGAFIVAQVMCRVFKRKNDFKASLWGVATVQEEVGLRGAQTAAYGIDPMIGIAIDVTHATDTPDTYMKKDRYGDIELGKGAAIARGPNINSKIFDQLVKAAKKNKIPYQVESLGRPTGTDANVIQVTRSGVATGLMSIPCRYMHTATELISLKDVESCISILTEFCLSINNKSDFVI